MSFTFLQLASDNFQRVNESPLSGGGNWLGSPTGSLSNLKIVSDLVESVTASDTFCFQPYSGGLTWPNDQYSEILVTTLANVNDFIAPLIRVSTSVGVKTFYWAAAEGPLGASTTIYLQRYLASAVTTLATLSVSLNSGDKLRIVAVGPTIAVYINGVLVPGSTIMDSSPIVSGLPGIATLTDSLANTQIGGWSGGNARAASVSTYSDVQQLTGAMYQLNQL